MKLSIDKENLIQYVLGQINTFFPDKTLVKKSDLLGPLNSSFEKMENCFQHVRNKYFFDGENVFFNHLHTDQYAMFLYILSRNAFLASENHSLADKLYALNKALHGIDVYYEVELPEIFYFQHPVGTVLGRAKYANFFKVYQNCTVGSNLENQYPILDEGVVMYGGSSIIGQCHVGSNVWISAGTTLRDQDAPSQSVIFGVSPQISFKPSQRNVRDDLFFV
ncbi:MAG: serine acetyltransferase [Candidatus Omnitrophica bacterium]|nr:serine acetyltransferase [Candidatus Omnitrophota bacterium]